MTSKRLLIGASILVCGFFLPGFAQPATQPASSSSDPNWIGPRSWQRHFTIPAFVQTSRGLSKKIPTSRPASYSKEPVSYWASRQRRTNKEGSSSASSSTSSSESRSGRYARSEGSSRSSRSSSEGRSSRRERRSRDY